MEAKAALLARIGAGPYTNAAKNVTRGKERGLPAACSRDKCRLVIHAGNPLVLGSASPRRRDFIASLGVPFVVRTAPVDETVLPGELPRAYVDRVTRAKLAGVQALDLGAAAGVLVADTVVVAPDGALLGKPRDDDHARSILEQLAGDTHEVTTQFVLAPCSSGAPPSAAHAQATTTRVTFRRLSAGEIRAYVAGGEGRDKAGSYAIQGGAASFVERIEGSFTNVVGLPLCEVVVALRALGWLATP
ncbi:MAG TPA: Maf family protein [Polyangiaceae bacterium]|nr:Maf family protein [Polyangiaceae bacterium]